MIQYTNQLVSITTKESNLNSIDSNSFETLTEEILNNPKNLRKTLKNILTNQEPKTIQGTISSINLSNSTINLKPLNQTPLIQLRPKQIVSIQTSKILLKISKN